MQSSFTQDYTNVYILVSGQYWTHIRNLDHGLKTQKCELSFKYQTKFKFCTANP